jgi:hypothetical protein
VADHSLFTGPWTKRQIVAYVIFGIAFIAACIGLYQIRDTIKEEALVLLVTSIAVLCGTVVYLIASEDRGTGLVKQERREGR